MVIQGLWSPLSHAASSPQGGEGSTQLPSAPPGLAATQSFWSPCSSWRGARGLADRGVGGAGGETGGRSQALRGRVPFGEPRPFPSAGLSGGREGALPGPPQQVPQGGWFNLTTVHPPPDPRSRSDGAMSAGPRSLRGAGDVRPGLSFAAVWPGSPGPPRLAGHPPSP